MFLLDTNVISEWVRPNPNASVIRWHQEADEDQVFLSVASFAEIRNGLERMPGGRRRDALATWLVSDLPRRFSGRIIPIDLQIADMWGVFMARVQNIGVALSAMDAFFAATAKAHSLTLVTRNVRDFRALEISLLDPWSGASIQPSSA